MLTIHKVTTFFVTITASTVLMLIITCLSTHANEQNVMVNGNLPIGENINIRHERSKVRHTAEKEQQHQHQHQQQQQQRKQKNMLKKLLVTSDVDDDNEGFGKASNLTQKQHNVAAISLQHDYGNNGNTTIAIIKRRHNNENFTTTLVNSGIGIKARNLIEFNHFNGQVNAHYATDRPAYLTTTVTMMPAVTHRIRKLHKKEITESLRRNNSNGSRKVGDDDGGNHRRSLVQAEQLQRRLLTNINNNNNNNNNDDEDDEKNVVGQQLKIALQNDNFINYDFSYQNDEEQITNVEFAGNDEYDTTTLSTMQAIKHNDKLFDEDIRTKLKKSSEIILKEVENDLPVDPSYSPQPILNVLNLSRVYHDLHLEEIENDLTVEQTTTLPLNFDDLVTDQLSDAINQSKFHLFSQNPDRTEDSQLWSIENENFMNSPRLSASTSVGGKGLDTTRIYKLQEINFIDSSDDNDSATNSPNDNNDNINNSIMDDAFLNSNNNNNNDNNNNNLEFSSGESETEDMNNFSLNSEDDETNHFLEGVVDAANSDEIYDWDEISRNNRRNLMRGRDVVTKFLQIVETQHSLGSNCEAGTSLNLGEGVVDRYAQDRFRIEAEVAVNRANMLTRIFKMTSPATQGDINLLHASVLSMVEFDDDIFAAGNCFDWNEHPAQPGLFCPFAYRLPPPNLGAILAKDLAMEYHYLGNTSEWFFQARKNAEKVIARNEQYLKAFHLYSNKSDERIEDDTLAVKYEDGRWSKPYYDCGGGNIWMLTYTVPFFGYENGTYHFKGTSGIDIDLRRVDIDQCPQRNTPGTTQPLNIFAGTDKCKQRTTMCEALKGLGFRRGSYKCVCRKGYYFPDTGSQHKYFNGSLLEVEYEKLMLVVRAASPALLRVIALGAFLIYCTNIVMYPNPNLYTCTARIWLREIGFSLTYGALMLKTWRISVIFRVRSAKAVKITDAALLKRLGCICGAIGTCLLVRTLVSPPDVVVGRTADDLKAFLCKTDWWDYTFTSMEVVFLAWGVRLCIMVRKAPSEFNESRFISMAIYNEFLLTCFLNVSMLFLQSPANPDLLYIIFFCHTQLTITLLLCLIFGSKVYIVLRSGKSHQESISMGAKSTGAKFNFRPQVRTFVNTGSVTASTAPIAGTSSLENKLSEQEALEEIRQLSVQLQRIQEMAPPKGVAVMTISSLLDGLKTPGGVMMVAAAATQAVTSANQLTLSQRKPEALPLLSLNNEMQKYTQLKVPTLSLPPTTATSNTIPATVNNNVCSSSTIAASELQPSSQPPSTYVTTMTTNNTTKLESQLKSYCKEKSINTDLSGNCISVEMLSNHRIICGRCYEQCTQHYHTMTATDTATANSPCKHSHELAMQQPVNKCQLLGSPQPEGIGLRFKNVKLDCMCSQADDLDQLPQRRISCRKRSAATNTPPCTSRNRYNQSNQSNAKVKGHSTSSASLPCVEATTIVPSVSYRICDSCKTKFSVSSKMTKKKHRKLAQLSSKCSKLLSELEEKNIKTSTSITTTASQILEYGTNVTQLTEKVYSTDDIIFYTTTDEDDEDENNYSDSDSDSYEDNNSKGIKLSCDVSKVSLSNLSSTHEAKVSETQPLTDTITLTSHVMPESNAEKLDTEHSKPSSSQTTDPSNGRPKRPDKLILNLNDRSKFTKEVSV
ncbi:uncharacterized protein ACN427_000581 isoform 2-T3 [Glossina fuscipes fuscipes]